ncbi:Rhomboid-like protein 19 [Pichia kudriavzevii]|nr:Rhomboid-like protein 19 [Pichia kudriavzevii]
MNGTILPVSGGSSLNSDTIRGDPSDTFALVEFFPDVLKPTLRPLFEGFYQLSVLLGIVRPWNDDDVDIGNLRSNLRVSGPSLANKRTNSSTFMNTTGNSKNLKSETDDEIAERRKQIALKVLEETANKK